jgi:hypothetical protein
MKNTKLRTRQVQKIEGKLNLSKGKEGIIWFVSVSLGLVVRL